MIPTKTTVRKTSDFGNSYFKSNEWFLGTMEVVNNIWSSDSLNPFYLSDYTMLI